MSPPAASPAAHRAAGAVDAARRAVAAAAATPGTTEHVLAGLAAPIAVVGNATPNHAWGATLDRYPTVIRLNNFRTRGYEALVGRRTDVWCTSGWDDIDPRAVARVVSPFAISTPESAHLAAFAAWLGRPVSTASNDVRALCPDVPKPSTGLALALLLDALGVAADLFLFDGFRSGHYWASGARGTTHSTAEWTQLCALEHLALHGGPLLTTPAGPSVDLDAEGAAAALAASTERRPGRLLLAGGDARLAGALEARGMRVVQIGGLDDPARHADGVFALASLEAPVDLGVVVAPVDSLPPPARRAVERHLARLATRIVVLGRGPTPVHSAWPEDHGWRDTAAAATPLRVTSWRGRGRQAAGERPGRYALPAHYVERAVPEYFDDRDGGVVWQPDVYRFARDLARHLGSRRIVDVGCGQGRKLAALHPELEVVGFDWGANLAACRAAYPWGRWLELDLDEERPAPLAIPEAELGESVVVCADVIEHLQTPDRLLTRLREILQAAPCAVLTTPERELTHGTAHLGPPPNAAHVREWTVGELQRYVETMGLEVAFAGLTASESADFRRQTSLLVLRGASIAGREGEVGAWAGAQLALYERERGTRAAPVTPQASPPASAPEPTPLRLQPRDPDAALTVSVVMRTKDRPALLERAIRSVRAQTWADWQLVVVNDGGDRAAVEAAVRAAGSGDPRVRVVHQPASQGMEAATNAGLEAARGTWVTLLDDDDTWEPGFLDACVRRLRAQAGTSVRGVVTHSTRVEETAVGAAIVERGRTAFTPSLRAVTLAELTQRNLFPVNAFVYDRRVLETIGGYRADLPVLGDWEFNLRFLRHFDVEVLPEALANYHQRPDAASGTCANSPGALHLDYQARLRNAWLRADLDRGVPGIGVLANLALASAPLQQLLAERDAHTAMLAALRSEADALRGERSRLQAAVAEAREALRAREWRDLHVPAAERLVRRLRRRHAGPAVVLIGAGELAHLLADTLGAAAMRVVAIGDNDRAKWGTAWRGLRVGPVAEAVAADAELIVVASLAHRAALGRQVRGELTRQGLSRRVETLAAD